MVFELSSEHIGFPDPSLAEPDGFLAVGGGMSVEWLLTAYSYGIFPWYDDAGGTPYWYSPEQRMVLLPSQFRCSKSLKRTLRSGRYEVRIDTCFRDVMEKCASVTREGQPGTWISGQFVDAFCKLHEHGFAHSFETFADGELVGGLYGVSLSDYFCGESMFHTANDASKVAFARLVDFARFHNFRFIDAQMYTSHLASLGAREMPRDDFLRLLEQQQLERTYRCRWCNNSVALLLGGNEGDRVQLIMNAIAEVATRVGTVSMLSPLYETEPWGFDAEQPFLNMALVVDTDKTADEVLDTVMQIEADLGRQRPADTTSDDYDGSVQRHYSSRPIDIDLIFYNNSVVETPRLTLPHPRMHQRRFVLEPLAQIIPDYIHPKIHKTVHQLCEECDDKCHVELFFTNANN